MDSIYKYALLCSASFLIGVLTADPTAFAINNAGDLGGLLAGFSAFFASIIAFDAKNTWKKQIQHKYQHDCLIDFKKALLELEQLIMRSRAILHGSGRIMRMFARSQGNEEAVQASREYLESFKNDFHKASQSYQQCLTHSKIVSTPINKTGIKHLSEGIKSLQISIDNELKGFENNTHPKDIGTLPDDFYKKLLNSIHILFNTSLHD